MSSIIETDISNNAPIDTNLSITYHYDLVSVSFNNLINGVIQYNISGGEIHINQISNDFAIDQYNTTKLYISKKIHTSNQIINGNENDWECFIEHTHITKKQKLFVCVILSINNKNSNSGFDDIFNSLSVDHLQSNLQQTIIDNKKKNPINVSLHTIFSDSNDILLYKSLQNNIVLLHSQIVNIYKNKNITLLSPWLTNTLTINNQMNPQPPPEHPVLVTIQPLEPDINNANTNKANTNNTNNDNINNTDTSNDSKPVVEGMYMKCGSAGPTANEKKYQTANKLNPDNASNVTVIALSMFLISTCIMLPIILYAEHIYISIGKIRNSSNNADQTTFNNFIFWVSVTVVGAVFLIIATFSRVSNIYILGIFGGLIILSSLAYIMTLNLHVALNNLSEEFRTILNAADNRYIINKPKQDAV